MSVPTNSSSTKSVSPSLSAATALTADASQYCAEVDKHIKTIMAYSQEANQSEYFKVIYAANQRRTSQAKEMMEVCNKKIASLFAQMKTTTDQKILDAQLKQMRTESDIMKSLANPSKGYVKAVEDGAQQFRGNSPVVKASETCIVLVRDGGEAILTSIIPFD